MMWERFGKLLLEVIGRVVTFGSLQEFEKAIKWSLLLETKLSALEAF